MALPKVTEPIAGQWPVSVAWRGWLESLDRRISLLANTEAPTQTPPDPPQLVQGEGINVYGGIGWGQVATLSLRLLPDSGVGAALVKITRDQYGRVEGTEAAALDDLSDVNAPSPSVGDALVWTGASYEPQAVATAQTFNRIDAAGDIRVAADGSLRITD